MKPKTHLVIRIGFVGVVLLVMLIKAWNLGWLQPKIPLNLYDQPAVLVFVKYHGVCECERFVNDNALAQVASWQIKVHNGVNLLQIDIEHRPDIAKQYKVIRVPSMVLLDANGEIVWRQDGVLSDELPLDLPALEAQITDLLASKER